MILITRPKEDNLTLSRIFKENKIAHYKEDLTRIREIKKKLEWKKGKVFIIASMYAVQAISSKKNIDVLNKSNVIVIGTRVKKALQELKIKSILMMENNSELLIKKIKSKQILSQSSIEYLCSNIYNKEFVQQLRKLNSMVTLNKVYETIPKSNFKKSTLEALTKGKINVVIFFSSFAFNTFIKLSKRHGIIKKNLKGILFVAFSDRIGREMKKLNLNVKSIKPSTVEGVLKYINKLSQSIKS